MNMPRADSGHEAKETSTVLSRPASKHSLNDERSLISRPRSAKATFAGDPDAVSPMMLGGSKDVDDFNLDRAPRQFTANIGKRLSGRLSSYPNSPLWTALSGTSSQPPKSSDGQDINENQNHVLSDLFLQIAGWLADEKSKMGRRTRKGHLRIASTDDSNSLDESSVPTSRRSSDASETTTSLEKLERIIERGMHIVSKGRGPSRPASLHNKSSLMRKLRRRSNADFSDADLQDTEDSIPSCNVVLDNSKTMSHFGGTVATQSFDDLTRSWTKDNDEWHSFKYEILRLAHTLKLKRWRMVPMERSRDIEVERLTGALTNAVYVVSPPKDIGLPMEEDEDGSRLPGPTKKPIKLLLRVYGPQADHLIDRDVELGILKRLGRKNIGPRLLGTFKNGRFEQFFNARTLRANDLRVPDTSRQIAKRMCELHRGVDLLDQEREDGPFVWKNWEKWVGRGERVVSFIEKESKKRDPNWRANRICGTSWSVFRRTVEHYRKWLEMEFGGVEKLKERLVFAHNDTQYGNILRILPTGESPLLLPANEHKQLVVIDFEYSNANTPGFEFANHFSEWCYDYHDPSRPFVCNTARYPRVEEQQRFIRAYIQHRPYFAINHGPRSPDLRRSPQLTPVTPGAPLWTPGSDSVLPEASLARQQSMSSLRSFKLDSRHPQAQYRADEEAQNQETEQEVQTLMHETRLWRVACSAQWVTWGLVQARIPGLDFEESDEVDAAENSDFEGDCVNAGTDPLDAAAQGMADDLRDRRPSEDGPGEDEEAEFDYLAYSRERALLFWGDILQMTKVLGLEDTLDIPDELREQVKHLPY